MGRFSRGQPRSAGQPSSAVLRLLVLPLPPSGDRESYRKVTGPSAVRGGLFGATRWAPPPRERALSLAAHVARKRLHPLAQIELLSPHTTARHDDHKNEGKHRVPAPFISSTFIIAPNRPSFTFPGS